MGRIQINTTKVTQTPTSPVIEKETNEPILVDDDIQDIDDMIEEFDQEIREKENDIDEIDYSG